MVALEMGGSTAPATQVREAVAVFDDPDRLDGAVAELQQCGFNRADLSIADGERCRTLGIAYTDAREIEDDPKVPRTVFISKASVGDAEGVLIGGAVYLGAVIAAGISAASGVGIAGTIAIVTLAAALTGAVGLYLRGSVHRRYVGTISDQMRHGGIVLWVNLHSPEQEQCALGILNRFAAKRVHVHEVPAL